MAVALMKGAAMGLRATLLWEQLVTVWKAVLLETPAQTMLFQCSTHPLGSAKRPTLLLTTALLVTSMLHKQLLPVLLRA